MDQARRGERTVLLTPAFSSSHALSALEQMSRVPLIEAAPAELVDVSTGFPTKLKCLGRSQATEMPQRII